MMESGGGGGEIWGCGCGLLIDVLGAPRMNRYKVSDVRAGVFGRGRGAEEGVI